MRQRGRSWSLTTTIRNPNIARPFDGQTPLFERAVVIGFDPFGGAQRGLETARLRRVESPRIASSPAASRRNGNSA